MAKKLVGLACILLLILVVQIGIAGDGLHTFFQISLKGIIMSFLSASALFLSTVSLGLFSVLAVVLILLSLWGLYGKENRAWFLPATILYGVTIVRFVPDWKIGLAYAGGLILSGMLYSFYRWRKASAALAEALRKPKNEQEFRTLIRSNAFKSLTFVSKEMSDEAERILDRNPETYLDKIWEFFTPTMSRWRGKTTAWIIFWPIYAVSDLTVDLISNLIDLFGGVYQRIVKSSYTR